jgi:hypothetical protein
LAFELINAAGNGALEVGCWKPTEAKFHQLLVEVEVDQVEFEVEV